MDKKRGIRKKMTALTALFLSFTVLIFTFTCRMRPVVTKYSETVAKRILLNSANQAVVKVLSEYGITYDDIVKISTDGEGTVTSLQIDTIKINMLKSGISLATSQIVSGQETFHTYIPIGTFLGSEYTNGLGPKIMFTAQLTSNTIVTFSNEFKEAGVNQVMHRILFEIETSGRLVMLGKSDAFTVATSAVIAETVIVGTTPDALTDVIEAPNDDLAETINDYGAQQ